jgi:hypothetical protein
LKPPLRTILQLGPALIPCAWLLAGRWHDASADQRAWLELTSVLCAVMLVPAGPAASRRTLASVVRIWGWVTAAGLLVMS